MLVFAWERIKKKKVLHYNHYCIVLLRQNWSHVSDIPNSFQCEVSLWLNNSHRQTGTHTLAFSTASALNLVTAVWFSSSRWRSSFSSSSLRSWSCRQKTPMNAAQQHIHTQYSYTSGIQSIRVCLTLNLSSQGKWIRWCTLHSLISLIEHALHIIFHRDILPLTQAVLAPSLFSLFPIFPAPLSLLAAVPPL